MAKRYLESGSVAQSLGFSTVWLNELVRRGDVTPDAVTNRGTNLYEPASVERIKRELSKRDR